MAARPASSPPIPIRPTLSPPTLSPPTLRGLVAAAILAAIVGLGLVGCAPGHPASPPAPTASPNATPAAEPAPEPTLAPGTGASENLAYFDFIAAGVLRADAAAGGRDFIDALIAGGFDRSELEVTFDRTQTDLAADSIQFSVRVHGECLIGQNGPAAGGYHSVVADVLGSGRCLVGSTRQIDW